MTTMISEVYDALKDAEGVSDEKARRAAEAVAQFDTRVGELKESLDAFRADVNLKFEGVNTKIEGLNTKIEGLNTKIEGLRGEMNSKFDGLRGEMNSKFDGLRGEMSSKFDSFRGDMNARFEAQAGRMTLHDWALRLIVGGVIALLLKAFIP